MASSLRSLLTMPGILWWGLDVWMGALLELLAISLRKQRVRSNYQRLFLVFGYRSWRAVQNCMEKISEKCDAEKLLFLSHSTFSFIMLLSIYCKYAWNRQMNINSNFNSGTLTVITGANSIFFTPTLSQPSGQWFMSFPLQCFKESVFILFNRLILDLQLMMSNCGL